MARRIAQTHPIYELRWAQVRVARHAYPCDDHACYERVMWKEHGDGEGNCIRPGDTYAYVSTGLRFCSAHFTADHIEDARDV